MKYDDEQIEKDMQNSNMKLDWFHISRHKILSESFIEKHLDKLYWIYMAQEQNLSESFLERHKSFLERHKYETCWIEVSRYQSLSESFIEKHQDKLSWEYVSAYQVLSESFIEKHSDKVDWNFISAYQILSEDFIVKHTDKVNWTCISTYQNLSKSFIKKYKDKLNYKLAKEVSKQPSIRRRIARAKKYARINNLEIKDGYLYAYRDHDKSDKGKFHSRIRYDKKNYEYRDWHCDPRKNEENSYGLGIFPEGNTKVRVKLEDFVVSVDHRYRTDYKGRVWAFEIVE